MMQITPETEAFWAAYCAATGHAGDYAVSLFGDSATLSEELLALVLSGRKRATGASVDLMRLTGEPVPQAGDHVICVDFDNRPRCIWRTTQVLIGPLSSVDEQFAFDEGEGDRTRADWLEGHSRYFQREAADEGYVFAADMPVVFERFTLVWPPELADEPMADGLRLLRGRYDRLCRLTPFSADPQWRFHWLSGVFCVTGPDPEPHGNTVLLPDVWTEAAARQAIAAVKAHYGALGHGVEWKLHQHDRPACLPDLLAEAGFTPQAGETLVIRDLTAAPPRPFALPDGVRLQELTTEADFAALRTVNTAVYGDPAQSDWLAGVLWQEKQHSPDHLRLFALSAGEEPVSVGWLRLPQGEGFASLWGGSTRADWRGRGLYRWLVEHRAGLALAAGQTGLTIDCSPMSLPIALANGFQELARITPWIWRPVVA